MTESGDVTITLTSDEALVLFKLLRLMHNEGRRRPHLMGAYAMTAR